jgi:hypothetical protein
VLDLFYPERQDKDEEKNDQEPEIYKNVHSVHLFCVWIWSKPVYVYQHVQLLN